MKNSKYVGVRKIYMRVYAHKRIKNETNDFHVPKKALVAYVTTTCRTRVPKKKNLYDCYINVRIPW